MTMVMTFGMGTSMATPDVCKTPPLAAPAPFPNVGNNALAVPSYFTLMINGMPELNLGGMYAITSGDEVGAMGGVASQVIAGPGRPVMGSQCVFSGGMPLWLMGRPTLQNLTNAPGVTMAPSQTVKVVLR